MRIINIIRDIFRDYPFWNGILYVKIQGGCVGMRGVLKRRFLQLKNAGVQGIIK